MGEVPGQREGTPAIDGAIDWVLTEADIEYLVREGELEIEVDDDQGTPLIRLTRRIAEQYLARFASWTQSQEPPEVQLALEAAAEVDRLASTSGDEALREVLATIPKPEATSRGWFAALRQWVERFASLVGPTR